MTNNTDPARALIPKWRGTHGGGFTSQGEFQAHLGTLRTCADELESALAAAPPSAPVGVEWLRAELNASAAYAGDYIGDERVVLLAVAMRKIDKLAALAQQPAAPSGEAVARVNFIGGVASVEWIAHNIAASLRHDMKLYAAPQQPAAVDDPIAQLIAAHSELVRTGNHYAYFELAYTRQTGWMAWLTDKPLHAPYVANPDRKVIAQGQGETPQDACAAALAANRQEGE